MCGRAYLSEPWRNVTGNWRYLISWNQRSFAVVTFIIRCKFAVILCANNSTGELCLLSYRPWWSRASKVQLCRTMGISWFVLFFSSDFLYRSLVEYIESIIWYFDYMENRIRYYYFTSVAEKILNVGYFKGVLFKIFFLNELIFYNKWDH